jgi:uncharacterized membrane protein
MCSERAIRNIQRYLCNQRSPICITVALATGIVLCFSVLEPIFLSLGWKYTVQFINMPLALICHQLPSRSLEIFGFRLAVCARCFSFFLAIFICSFWYWIFGIPTRSLNPKTLLLLVFPLVIDGTTQHLGFRISTNTLRVLTGFAAGAGTSLTILPFLTDKSIQATLNLRQGDADV